MGGGLLGHKAVVKAFYKKPGSRLVTKVKQHRIETLSPLMV